MALLKQASKARLDRRRSLAGKCLLRDGVEIVEKPDGTLTVRLTVRRGGGFFELFRPAVTEKKYELDEFGSFVLREIRRRQTVLEIISAFESRFRLTHRESELGVVAFVKMLMQRNVVTVVTE